METIKKLKMWGAEKIYSPDYVEAEKEKIEAKYEQKRIASEERRAEKEAIIAEKEAQREEKKSIKERLGAFMERFNNVEAEDEEGLEYFNFNEGEEFSSYLLNLDNLVDDKFNKFEKPLKGENLLKRNLNTSKLYLEDEGNFIRINSIRRCYSDEEEKNVSNAYLAFETKFGIFVIPFPRIEQF